MEIIKTVDLSKRYGALSAVDSINLTINKGEIFGLLGPNGAGKTTTLMMLSSLLKPTSGTATVNGFDVLKQSEQVRESIGMVFQDPSSDPVLSAYDNLKLHALLYDVPLKSIDAKISQVLSLVDLEKRKHDLVKTFSGGMRRRMEIARGLLHEPRIFFLDEPTLGLDPQTRDHIWQYIKTLAEKIQMTIILTTHYMEEAEKLCDRIAIIDQGKIVALDSPANLIRAIGGDIVQLRGVVNTDAVKKLPFVRDIRESDHSYYLSVENAAQNLQKLLAVAGTIDFVAVHSPDLKDVFLRYTGRAMREEEGDLAGHLRNINRVLERK
ncbi:MAG: ATP-binding cassette domain-containing protein [Elusimicrobia bacterium]|nr:ATP-binding cassette domain-containing protein [Elusimicrobiota bacterium]